MTFLRLSINIFNKSTSKLTLNKMKNLKNIFITPSNTEVEKKLASMLNSSDNYQISNLKENSIKVFLDHPESKENNFLLNGYDIRIIIGKEETESVIADRILNSLHKDQEYLSTRGSRNNYTFFDVIRDGLAPDRGLFVPKYFPTLNSSQWLRLVPLTYQERCLRILEGFPLGELKPSQLSKMINDACSTFTDEKILPLYKVPNSDNQYIMEEFYGPSASFKDLALQLFPRLFQESIKNYERKIAILVATSGDTGSAVLSGFKEIGIPVIVLYPHNKVSQIQEAQMITAEGNVKVIAVKGDFDFCQSCVKDIFQDSDFTENLKSEFNLSLTSANSINWGRLLPQVCYVIHSYLEMVKVKLKLSCFF
jgi:threonine synthase